MEDHDSSHTLPLETLPTEVIAIIFNNVDDATKLNALKVSSRIRNIITEHVAFNNAILDDANRLWFMKHLREAKIESLTLRLFCGNAIPNTKVSSIRSIFLNGPVLGSILTQIAHDCKNLNRLRIEQVVGSIDPISAFSLPKLKELKVFEKAEPLDINLHKSLLCSSFPALESFVVEREVGRETVYHGPALFRFLLRNGNRIKDLKLSDRAGNVTEVSKPLDEKEQMELEQLSLHTLKVYCSSGEDIQSWALVAGSQTRLKECVLKLDSSSMAGFPEELLHKVVEKNTVSLSWCDLHIRSDAARIEASIFAPLLRLSKLSLTSGWNEDAPFLPPQIVNLSRLPNSVTHLKISGFNFDREDLLRMTTFLIRLEQIQVLAASISIPCRLFEILLGNEHSEACHIGPMDELDDNHLQPLSVEAQEIILLLETLEGIKFNFEKYNVTRDGEDPDFIFLLDNIW